MTQLLADVGTFFTSALGWLGDGLDTVMGSPALFVLVFAMPIAGFGIGLLKRLISL